MALGPVLIVDDCLREVRTLVYALHQKEVSTLVADGGETALHLAQTHRPPLIVADLDMPRMSGHELLDHLNLDPGTRDLTVILFHTEWVIAVGPDPPLNAWSRPTPSGRTADLHWTKPIEVRQWVSGIERLLQALQRDH